MNVTKNQLIEALNYLGEFPKSSSKKEELIEMLNKIYSAQEIEKLVIVINLKIYDLIKRLVKADENGIDVEKDDKLEVDFLEGALIIEEPVIDNNKIHIKFKEGMKNKFIKFVNNKNEENIKKNQIIINLIINIVDVYGMIQDYEMLEMLNRLLGVRMGIENLFALINYQIDLRNEITIGESENELYFMSCFVKNPEDIIAERETRDLYYKEYTIQELEENTLNKLATRKEALAVVDFLKKKKIKFAEEATLSLIISIMNTTQIDISEFMQIVKIDLEDIDEANEYLQLIMNLHNSIPQYSLYGYSSNELLKMKIEAQKKEEEKKIKIK